VTPDGGENDDVVAFMKMQSSVGTLLNIVLDHEVPEDTVTVNVGSVPVPQNNVPTANCKLYVLFDESPDRMVEIVSYP
jgi:hypothetical protein